VIDADCAELRECHFGSNKVYQQAKDWLVDTALEGVCNRDCGCEFAAAEESGICVCGVWSSNTTSCPTNECTTCTVCTQPFAHLILTYSTKGLDTCEPHFRTAQLRFENICGHFGSSCCNGNCNPGVLVDENRQTCHMRPGITESDKWFTSSFVVFATCVCLFASLGDDEQLYQPVETSFALSEADPIEEAGGAAERTSPVPLRFLF